MKKMEDLDLEQDGIVVIPDFLSRDRLKEINEELDVLLSKISLNGGRFATALFGGMDHKLVTDVGQMKSINVFETTIDIARIAEQRDPTFHLKDFFFGQFEIYSDSNSETPLFWHSDQNRRKFRASIYLKGGGRDSGMFQYMLGTHRLDLNNVHKTPPEDMEKYRDQIFECDAPEGALVIFDSYGHHARYGCKSERRIAMAQFTPRTLERGSASNMGIPFAYLTPKVLAELDFFRNTHGVYESEHDVYSVKPPMCAVSSLSAYQFYNR